MRIYQADIYCDECGQKIEASLIKPTEELWDSDDYPNSFPDNEESDSPQHCAACLRPIETTLTPDGIKLVLAAVKTEFQNELRWEINDCYKGTYYEDSPHIAIVADWVEQIRHYGGLPEEAEALIEGFDKEYKKIKDD